MSTPYQMPNMPGYDPQAMQQMMNMANQNMANYPQPINNPNPYSGPAYIPVQTVAVQSSRVRSY